MYLQTTLLFGVVGDISRAHIVIMEEYALDNIMMGNAKVSIYNARYAGKGPLREKAVCFKCKGHGEHYLYIIASPYINWEPQPTRTSGGWFYAHFCSVECITLYMLDRL